MIESGRFGVVRLEKIFRQAQESLIITNAHRINAGELPALDVKDNDFFFLRTAAVPQTREADRLSLPRPAAQKLRRLTRGRHSGHHPHAEGRGWVRSS